MRKLNILLKSSLAMTAGWLACGSAWAAPACQSLQGQTIGGALITSATAVTTGSLDVNDLAPYAMMSGRRPGPTTITSLPNMCRVLGSVHNNPTSNVEFELWLPMADWNKRLVMWGNGGPAGFISYGTPELPMMQGAVRAGYATVSTNTGHWRTPKDQMMAFPTDMTDQAYLDFGYRAVHVTAVASKAIVRRFYAGPAQYSYFSGCSTGGRQGMMEARRYPTDFNGILSGAGVYNFSTLAPLGMWQTAIKTSAGLTPEVGHIIKQAIKAQCNPRSDGFVVNPGQCRIDPVKLLCKPDSPAGDCLTPAQAVGVQRLIDGPVDAAGRPLGYGTPVVMLDFTPLPFPVPASLDFEAAARATGGEMHAGETSRQYIDGDGTDIAPFFAAGGKLLMYHGWTDPLVAVANSVVTFDDIRDRIGDHAADGQLRLFLAPGMGHCAGGNGGNFFGQYHAPMGGNNDPSTNILQALEDWVERGKEPKHIVATKYEGDNQTKRVIRSTLLCPYPQAAKYNGSGDVEDAANYSCASPG
jgi:hypothetical protein